MELTNKTLVAEIVRSNYSTAHLFEKNNIDFCCGGNIALEEACVNAGVKTDKLLSEIRNLLQFEDLDAKYIENLPLDRLCDYIVERHHSYVSDKIPFLIEKLQKLCDVHGANHPELFEVKELFDGAAGNLSAHMKKEELILFPYIKKMIKFKTEGIDKPDEFGEVLAPINVMITEHQTEGDRFKRLAEITGNYQVPADGCNTYMVTYKTLQEFENDLHRHIHLENNVLFLKAIELEQVLTHQKV